MAEWLPYLAVGISVITFLASQREIARRAKVDEVVKLEQRIKQCENDRLELKREVHVLRDENIDLMRRVVGLERG